MLINGKDINEAINNNEVGTVAAVNSEKGLALSKAAVDTLYLAALNRPCTNGEFQKIIEPGDLSLLPDGASGRRTPAEFHRAYYQDIFWALLNSSEFILNH